MISGNEEDPAGQAQSLPAPHGAIALGQSSGTTTRAAFHIDWFTLNQHMLILCN